ncbi:calcium/sodium antiporter [Demequina aurantiaca]|uniref:calcium/sodium antiporter n=1 Tax=Demequina aurantiaca TaxID=676200 RepID=UPI000781ADC5|nr:calcium/sodium antiporter [Demequina aurantiaca]
MTFAILATIGGLAILAWSADKFVLGAASVARYLGMAPLLIGMLVIGFGTSAPEMVVSTFAAVDGNPEIAIGNALGSNIANIGLILGVTAIVLPIMVHRGILRKELPVLIAATAVAWLLMLDGTISIADASILLVLLVVLITWSVMSARVHRGDNLAKEAAEHTETSKLSKKAAWTWLVVGLVLLVAGSRLLVWGAVEIAQSLGWSDLVIGLTVVAIGTSAPELAASLAAARKGENDLALGNIIGSNLFNTLGVIGIAGVITPIAVDSEVLTRDLPMVGIMTILLVVFAWGRVGRGRINRIEGAVLLAAWLAYTTLLLVTAG